MITEACYSSVISMSFGQEAATWEIDPSDLEAWLLEFDSDPEAWLQCLQTDSSFFEPAQTNLDQGNNQALPHLQATSATAADLARSHQAEVVYATGASGNTQNQPEIAPCFRSNAAARTSESGPSDRVQCFDHGCNGRIFSNRENYLRHLREKNGQGAIRCRYCGYEFTRRSNRDKHVAEGKCNRMN